MLNDQILDLQNQKFHAADIERLAKEYAERFDGESSGDSLREYVGRASYDVFPLSAEKQLGRTLFGKRANFRKMVLSAIGELQKS